METVTYFTVRTPGDGDFEFFEEMPIGVDGEVNFDQTDVDSAKKFAATLEGGYVVKVTEEVVA